MNVPIQILLPAKTNEQMKRIAAHHKRSKRMEIVTAVEDYVKKHAKEVADVELPADA